MQDNGVDEQLALTTCTTYKLEDLKWIMYNVTNRDDMGFGESMQY
jgi:hypothetical protein